MLVQCFINLFKTPEATEEGDSFEPSNKLFPDPLCNNREQSQAYSSTLQIAIKDSGKGVSDDLQAHIFEPFVSNKSGGSGLGLAMVASVIADHGAIAMQSSPQGACFTLNFPITQGYNNTASSDGVFYENPSSPDYCRR